MHSQSQQSIAHPSYSHHSIPCDFPDAVILSHNLDDDDEDEDDPSFIPGDSELESFSDDSSDEEELETTENQKTTPELKTPVNRRRPQRTPNKGNSTTSRRTRSRERVRQREICVGG